MTQKINSHNEWVKLKEVIVGTARQATVGVEYFNPDKISFRLYKCDGFQ